jgi:hypothetical protein
MAKKPPKEPKSKKIQDLSKKPFGGVKPGMCADCKQPEKKCKC